MNKLFKPFARFNSTHFGYRNIPKQEKENLVAQVFKSVAGQYDLMNDFMSMGIHRCWKTHFINELSPTLDMTLLDIAGGTGDISFKFIEYLQDEQTQENVTVVDINPEMLKVGRSRALEKGYDKLKFVEGNAEHLDFESSSVDAVTMAFGIRNCTNIDQVISEAYRVLKPGGRFMVLEFSHVENPILKQ
jgi:2-methoxy-6-polyprenyl-1,4-benzoquinol methylase